MPMAVSRAYFMRALPLTESWQLCGTCLSEHETGWPNRLRCEADTCRVENDQPRHCRLGSEGVQGGSLFFLNK